MKRSKQAETASGRETETTGYGSARLISPNFSRKRPDVPAFGRPSRRCASCAGRTHALCQALDADAHADLAHFSRELHLRAGSELFIEGDRLDAFYTVLDGWLFAYKLFEDGRRQILKIFLPGEVLGRVPPTDPRLSHASVQTLTPVRLCVLPVGAMKELMGAHPGLALRLADLTVTDLARNYRMLASLGRQSAYERVAYFLLDLYCRVRILSSESLGATIPLPLKQEHIADSLGLTSVHVSRVLGRLRQDGLVRIAHKALHVLDPDRLAEICEFDSDRREQLLSEAPGIAV